MLKIGNIFPVHFPYQSPLGEFVLLEVPPLPEFFLKAVVAEMLEVAVAAVVVIIEFVRERL